MINKIQNIFEQFDHHHNYVNHSEIHSGHINDTFFVKTDGVTNYIIQRINHNIFKNVFGLVNNKVLVSKHLKNKYSSIYGEELNQKVLSFVKAKKSNNYYINENGNFWNAMIFIENSKTFEIVKDEKIAYEAGKLLGDFLKLTSDFDSNLLVEVLPNFHDMSFRYLQYESSLKTATSERLKKANKYVNMISQLKEEMHILQSLKESGKIPVRVTHNDTKISNSLFNKENKGICMIDTDTVMPGIIHYDFGDAIRTICNTAAEDEKDLSKVEFNLAYYKAYKKGFIEKTKDSLTPIELEKLPLAAKTMIFIIGLRFLTDYLNNDVYYKTEYLEHNLDRAKNQFKLLNSLQEKLQKNRV
jgi:hypothetical protein